MKRYVIPVVLMMLLMSSAAWAQTNLKTPVMQSPHNIGTLGCKSCHAAHDGAASPGLPAGGNYMSGTVLLWDRNFTQTATFGTYTSPTLTSTVPELGTGQAGTIPNSSDVRQNSLLCMSCHDGVTSTTVLPSTSISAIGNTTTSAGLKNDHPVNMTYNPTLNPSLQAVTAVTGATGGLSLPGNTVQCSSCHTSHDNTNGKFLRKSNTGSALCLTCHK